MPKPVMVQYDATTSTLTWRSHKWLRKAKVGETYRSKVHQHTCKFVGIVGDADKIEYVMVVSQGEKARSRERYPIKVATFFHQYETEGERLVHKRERTTKPKETLGKAGSSEVVDMLAKILATLEATFALLQTNINLQTEANQSLARLANALGEPKAEA